MCAICEWLADYPHFKRYQVEAALMAIDELPED
jgi:hypothetical protein